MLLGFAFDGHEINKIEVYVCDFKVNIGISGIF